MGLVNCETLELIVWYQLLYALWVYLMRKIAVLGCIPPFSEALPFAQFKCHQSLRYFRFLIVTTHYCFDHIHRSRRRRRSTHTHTLHNSQRWKSEYRDIMIGRKLLRKYVCKGRKENWKQFMQWLKKGLQRIVWNHISFALITANFLKQNWRLD